MLNNCQICRKSAYANINIPCVTENITMEAPQKISIHTSSVAIACNRNLFIISYNILMAHGLQTRFHMSHVMSHMSRFMCQVSHVICQMPYFTFFFLFPFFTNG